MKRTPRKWDRSGRYGLADSVGLELRSRPCDLCASPPPDGRKAHSIDHDHASGRVRGVLCHHCNLALGHFKDDPELLTRAIRYLTRDSDYRAVDND